MLFRVCGHSKGLTFLTGLWSFIYVRANTLVSVSLPHPQHSINIRHLAVMATETMTFMNISLQIPSLQHILIKAVGNAQLPQIILMDTDLLSAMCALNTLAPELNTCTDLHETDI